MTINKLCTCIIIWLPPDNVKDNVRINPSLNSPQIARHGVDALQTSAILCRIILGRHNSV